MLLAKELFYITEPCQKLLEQLQMLKSLSKGYPIQGAIIPVPAYRRYAKIMVWFYFVFRQVPRMFAGICYSRTYSSTVGERWYSNRNDALKTVMLCCTNTIASRPVNVTIFNIFKFFTLHVGNHKAYFLLLAIH